MTLPFDWSTLKSQIDALLVEYPELQEDDVLRADMIEGATDIRDVIGKLAEQALDARSSAAAAGIRLAALQERRARFNRHDEALCAIMLKIMTAAGVKSIPLPECTPTVVAGKPHVIITDATMLPEELCNFDITPRKKAINERIDAGETVPGAVLSNSEPSLTIRVK